MNTLSESQQAVTVRSLFKSFRNGETQTEVLKGIDLDCHFGEILMIVGPSGCGKTTLLSCMAGTLSIDSGSVTVFEHRIEKMKEKELLRFRGSTIGFIFQQFNLIQTLTITENVSVPLFLNGFAEKEAFEQARITLGKVGLAGKEDRYPSQLSGGQQQRVAIARALVHKPRLVICDEPTASLDGKTGHQVVELLKEVAQAEKSSVIIVTHDSRIFQFANRMIEMEDGRIKAVYNNSQEFEHKSL